MRALNACIGLVLIPVIAMTALTVWDFLLASSLLEEGPRLPLETGALIGGFLFWLFFWVAMPKPVRTYVLAHELSHVVWGLAMGARVSDLRVRADSGSVKLSKTNALITLAPYFFPFYTIVVILLYGITLLFFDMAPYVPFWLALVGFTWGFHLTFTIATLATHQPDIEIHGRLFSYALITWLNLLGLCAWMIAVGSPRLEDFEARMTHHAARGAELARTAWQRIAPPP